MLVVDAVFMVLCVGVQRRTRGAMHSRMVMCVPMVVVVVPVPVAVAVVKAGDCSAAAVTGRRRAAVTEVKREGHYSASVRKENSH